MAIFLQSKLLVRRLLRLRRRQCSQGGRRRVPTISSYSEASESRQGTPRTSLRIATGLDRARERPNSARGSFSDVSHSLGDDELALALDALRAAEASGSSRRRADCTSCRPRRRAEQGA